jgi:hypothetical protein
MSRKQAMRTKPARRACALAVGAVLALLATGCQSAAAAPSRNFAAQATRNFTVESTSPTTGRKLALVIGNDDYPEAPLRNPLNDARDMAAALGRLGFEVIHKDNLNKEQMEGLVRQFGDRLRPGMVGLFYFAGHGMQLNGRNYLIPVDSGIQREDEVRYHAFDVGELLSKMESAGNNSNLVFLDACRDNPFARSFRSSAVRGGFSFGDAPSGTLIAYAAKSGMRSKDGDRHNGLYTETLLRHLATPGLKVTDLLIEVRDEVKRASEGEQIPWEEVGLEKNFCFAGCGGVPPQPVAQPQENNQNSRFKVGLVTLGTSENERQNLWSKLASLGFRSHKYGGAFSERENWIATTSTVFYYDDSAKNKAIEVANIMKRFTSVDFKITHGAGYGVDKNEKYITFFVHLIKPESSYLPQNPSSAFINGKYLKNCGQGTWNVIVASLNGDKGIANEKIQIMRNQHPNFQFRLWTTVAVDGESNRRFAIIIGSGLSSMDAKQLIALAKREGVAPDVYKTLQSWDSGECLDESGAW